MLFVLVYLLFFAVDMLAATNFLVLGMMSMSYLVAGVGFFTLFLLLKRKDICISHLKKQWIFYFFVFNVILVTGYNLNRCIPNLLNLIINHDIDFYLGHFVAGFSGFLLILMLRWAKKSSPVWRWMVYSSAAVLCHYALWEILTPVPVVIYRYYGIVDLCILFGWLMIVHTVLKEELVQSGYLSNTALR